MWWLVEMACHRWWLRPALKKAAKTIENMPMCPEAEARMRGKLDRETLRRQGKLVELGFHDSSDSQSQTQETCDKMLRFWRRESEIPLPGTYVWKARDRLREIADTWLLVFPSVGWWLIHACVSYFRSVWMVMLGFRSEVVNGITIWDNRAPNDDEPTVYLHGISPEGLLGQSIWFAKWPKHERLIIPINPVTSFAALLPQRNVTFRLIEATRTYLAQHRLRKVHLVGHSAGVAALNAWYASHTPDVMSRTCIDPVHHIWICRHAQKPLVKGIFRALRRAVSRFWDPTRWVEATLVFVLHCPALATYAVEITHDAAFYNFVDGDHPSLMFVLGKHDSLSNRAIPQFRQSCHQAEVRVLNTLHGHTLLELDPREILSFQQARGSRGVQKPRSTRRGIVIAVVPVQAPPDLPQF